MERDSEADGRGTPLATGGSAAEAAAAADAVDAVDAGDAGVVTDPAAERIQRRTLGVLVSSQILGAVAVASGIAVGSLLVEYVSGSTAMAGLAGTSSVLGAALLAVPLAQLAATRGRSTALTTGYTAGLSGAVLAVVAAAQGWVWLLLIGAMLFGGGTASNLQARYAATDRAEPSKRGRALSTVVWATTIGAVAGPNLSGVGGDVGEALGLPRLAGPYVFSIVAFGAAATMAAVGLRWASARRPDPAAAERDAAPGRRGRTWATVRALTAHPRSLLGLAAVATAHAVMVGVMSMTPVHMGHAGASLQVIGIVISVHIAGMYAASPVMGWLSDRIGRVPTIGCGLTLLLAACVLAATNPSGGFVGDGLAMALLGLGWSACLVAGSTLLSESAPEDIRTRAQGVSDLVMGLCGAGAGALAGGVLALWSYDTLAWAALTLLVPVVVLVVRQSLRARSA